MEVHLMSLFTTGSNWFNELKRDRTNLTNGLGEKKK